MDFEPERDYPLGTRRPDLVATPGGLPLSEVTLAAARDGRLDGGQIRATPETLRLQAEVARAAGRRQLAENLERAAELAAVPDGAILEVYTALRPRRSTRRRAGGLGGAARRAGAPRRPRPSCARRRRPTPSGASLPDSGRAASRAEKELRRELLVSPLPELGLVAFDGPNDPQSELVVEDGSVVRMDGRAAADFDVIDRFVAAHDLDLEVAAEAATLTDARIARMLVDVDVPREELVRLAAGLTPARLARVIVGCSTRSS